MTNLVCRFVENIPMDTVVLKEKDEWGRMTKETKTSTPTDYGVSAAEYALTVGIVSPPLLLLLLC